MLILTRKEGEAIAIGNDIVVAVTLIDGTHVRLGIEAPPEVVILREEIAPAATGAAVRSAHAAQSQLPLAHPARPGAP